MEEKGTCPLCGGIVYFGFGVVNNRAYIKYSDGEQDVLMNVDTVRNSVSITNMIRGPSVSKRFDNKFRQQKFFRAFCKTNAVGVGNYEEYSFGYSINLNKSKNQVIDIEIFKEDYTVLDGYDTYDVSVDHSPDKQSTVNHFRNEPVDVLDPDHGFFPRSIRSKEVTIPSYYFKEAIDVETILRKIKIIYLMKDE